MGFLVVLLLVFLDMQILTLSEADGDLKQERGGLGSAGPA